MAKLGLVDTEAACSMHLEIDREMAAASSEQNKRDDSGGSTPQESIMKVSFKEITFHQLGYCYFSGIQNIKYYYF